MFTGLIEETGNIKKVSHIAGGLSLKIQASKIMDDLKTDDSVSVNGVCLTATKITSNEFWVDAVGETLKKTNIQSLRESDEVNLERSVRLMDRLGGHLVQGHVNGIGNITNISKLGENYFFEIDVPKELEKYLIDEGSISIDGISLTIAQLSGTKIGISIIPHTWSKTILKNKRAGDRVNLETDVFAKYVEKILLKKNEKNKFTENWFKKLGY
jgi:riboflavin synthase